MQDVVTRVEANRLGIFSDISALLAVDALDEGLVAVGVGASKSLVAIVIMVECGVSLLWLNVVVRIKSGMIIVCNSEQMSNFARQIETWHS